MQFQFISNLIYLKFKKALYAEFNYFYDRHPSQSVNFQYEHFISIVAEYFLSLSSSTYLERFYCFPWFSQSWALKTQPCCRMFIQDHYLTCLRCSCDPMSTYDLDFFLSFFWYRLILVYQVQLLFFEHGYAPDFFCILRLFLSGNFKSLALRPIK